MQSIIIRFPNTVVCKVASFLSFREKCVLGSISRSMPLLLSGSHVFITWIESCHVDMDKIAAKFYVKQLSTCANRLSNVAMYRIAHTLERLDFHVDQWPAHWECSNLRELHLWSIKKMPTFQATQWPSLTSFTLCTRAARRIDHCYEPSFGSLNLDFVSHCRSLEVLQIIGIKSFASMEWLYTCTAKQVLFHSIDEMNLPLSNDKRVPLPNIQSLSLIFCPSGLCLSALSKASLFHSLVLDRTSVDLSPLIGLRSLTWKNPNWPPIEELPYLSDLRLQRISVIPTRSSSQSLDTLEIDLLFVELPECHFPNLKNLTVSHSHNIWELPSCPRLERLSLISNCNVRFESHATVRYVNFSDCRSIRRIICPMLLELIVDDVPVTVHRAKTNILS